MLIPHLQRFNLQAYVDTNRLEWEQGGILRKLLWEDSDYITFLTRGPTTAVQFHVNPGDEIFYQLEGELHFHYVTADGKRGLLVLQPVGMFLLPANVPHSPRRPAGSWTLVVERQRRPDEADRRVWFCERCGQKLYETVDRAGGPGDMDAGAVRSFQTEAREALQALGSCPRCGEAVPSAN